MVFTILGQQSQTGYTAFGETPVRVPKKLLDSLKNEANSLARFDLIDTIAKIHLKFGDTDSIVHYGQQLAREVEFSKSELLNKPLWLSKAYYIIGRGKQLNGLFDPALGYHLQALDLNVDDDDLLYKHQLGMARAYYSKKEYEKALPILLIIYEKASDLSISSTAGLYASLIFHKQKESTKADQFMTNALDRANSANNTKLRLTIELYQIRLRNIQEYDDTIFNKLEDIKDEAIAEKFYDIYTEAVIDISKMYVLTENTEEASMVLSIAYTNTLQWNRWQLQERIQAALIEFYRDQGDYKNAYAIKTQQAALKETIIKNQNYNAVRELEIKYETNKKEREIDRQRLIKNSILIGFLVLLGPVIALLVTYYQKLRAQIALNESQEIVNQQQVTALLKDQELKLIKASVAGENKERKRLAQELHDSIGGNLASIKLQLARQETKSPFYKGIAKQLDDTYEQVRNLSHNLTAKKFEQNAFTQLVSEYVTNINAGTNAEISFNPHPEDKVNAVNQNVQVEVFKLVQELLTNALKHAKASTIEIHLNAFDEKINLLFEDDGVGFDIEKVTLGIGLNGMKNRIANLAGTMMIDAIPRRGTVINIEIPI